MDQKSNPPVACLRRIGSADEDHKLIKLDSSEFVIGRAKEADYTIPDVLVSRRHAIFRYSRYQWTIESVGMNGVTLNHVSLPKNQQIPLNHMDTIEIGAGSKYLYAFRVASLESVCEPNAKRLRMPLANHNVPSLREAPLAFKNWEKSRKSLELTLSEESNTLDLKLERQKSLNEELIQERKKLEENSAKVKKELETKFAQERRELEDKVARGDLEKNELQKEKEHLERRMASALQQFQAECSRKTKDLEESLSKANTEKVKLLEEKEFIVQQLTREKDLLHERLQEESRLRAATLDELAKIKQSCEALERQCEEERRRFEEEKKKMQLKESEDETRLSRMSLELAERKAQLDAKEKEVVEIQSRAAIALDMVEGLQVIQAENSDNADIVFVLSGEPQESVITLTHVEDTTEMELERVRRELRTQMELKERELEQVSRQARQDILGKIESVLENELQCAICSELMVSATSLNCMHTFCLYCVNLWKANKLDCPQCRQPITSEGRNLVVDNMIDAMVANMSEEVQNRRKELVELRKALVAAQEEEKKNLLKRNSADSSRARSRRPRQEASFRATTQRRTLPTNQAAAAAIQQARVIVVAHAGSTAPVTPLAEARPRAARTAARQSIVASTSGTTVTRAGPTVNAAPTAVQRITLQPVAGPPSNSHRQPTHPVAAAPRHTAAPVTLHNGRRQQRRRRRVGIEEPGAVVVLSSDSESSGESGSEGALENESIMVIHEQVNQPRRRR